MDAPHVIVLFGATGISPVASIAFPRAAQEYVPG